MDKLAKLTSLLNDGEERDWIFRYKTKEITEHMDYIRPMWDDNASRTIWKDYATPLKKELSDLISHKEEALNGFMNLHSAAKSLFDNCIKIHGLSEEIDEKLNESYKEQRICDHNIVECTDFMDKIMHDAPIVDEGHQKWCDDESKFQYIYANRRKVYQ